MPKSLILAPPLPPEFKIATIPELALTRKTLLDSAKAVTVIEDEKTRDEVIKKSSLIAIHLRAFEADKKLVKAPFWQICQDIDRVNREHVGELEVAKDRLDSIVGDYEYKRERKAQAARDELARKAREIEAAAQRQRDEAAAALVKAQKKGSPAASLLAAELDAENAAEDAAEQQHQMEQQQIALAEEQRRQSATGGARRTTYDVEVTDIKALYAFNPLCVKMEPDIVMIKGLHARGVILPGVKITESKKFSARA